MATEKERAIRLLKQNHFIRIECNHYANDFCSVVFEDNAIAVANNSGFAEHSKNIDVYWLIGILIYKNFCENISTI